MQLSRRKRCTCVACVQPHSAPEKERFRVFMTFSSLCALAILIHMVHQCLPTCTSTPSENSNVCTTMLCNTLCRLCMTQFHTRVLERGPHAFPTMGPCNAAPSLLPFPLDCVGVHNIFGDAACPQNGIAKTTTTTTTTTTI